MNEKLAEIRDKFAGIAEKSDIVLGAWKFGSEARGLSDEYSDADVVLLIDGGKFGESEKIAEEWVGRVCDKILLLWEEEFNGDNIVNNGYLVSLGGDLFQFDVFLLNYDKINDDICRIHYAELTENNVIFDKNGAVKKLMPSEAKSGTWIADARRMGKTYWYHAFMAGKYIARKSVFKLRETLNIMYESHASLLLAAYGASNWGGKADRLNFIPEDKKEHLTGYWSSGDLEELSGRLPEVMRTFMNDERELCEKNNAAYSEEAGEKIIGDLIRKTSARKF